MEIVQSLDHVVLTVKDVRATCRFYSGVLGMRVETFDEGRTALHFGDQKINLHPAGNDNDLVAPNAAPGAGDLCFVTDLTITQLVAHLEACGVRLVEGPVERTGARGSMTSVYIRDPDMNLIEIAVYDE